MSAPLVTYEGQRAIVRFDEFDIPAYETFLRLKALPEKTVSRDRDTGAYTLTTSARFARTVFDDVPFVMLDRSRLAPHLFDYQSHFIGEALEAKRYAEFWDCGLGKGPAQLEYGRQVVDMTGGRFLHWTFRSIIPQMLKEAYRFYGDDLQIRHLKTRAELEAFLAGDGDVQTGIVNYEKLDAGPLTDLRNMAGIACDESSMLKTQGGRRKWNLMHSSRGIEYKLSLTATPAPNDPMEYLSQAGFLDKFDDGSGAGPMLAACFSRDKEQNWVLKGHARTRFYELLSAFSVYLRNPATYGFADNLKSIPDPEYITHEIEATWQQMELARAIFAEHGSGLFGDDRMGVVPRMKLAQIARGFRYTDEEPSPPAPSPVGTGDGMVKRAKAGYAEIIPSIKPFLVAEIIRDELDRGNQVLVWTAFDQEADELLKYLPRGKFEVLDGRVKSFEERERIIERTETGDTAGLISKGSALGFGRNLQQFGAQVVFGFDDSFERLYQMIRRSVRYGQTKKVRVHLPYVPDLEGPVFRNLMNKAAAFEADAAAMEAVYRKVLGYERMAA